MNFIPLHSPIPLKVSIRRALEDQLDTVVEVEHSSIKIFELRDFSPELSPDSILARVAVPLLKLIDAFSVNVFYAEDVAQDGNASHLQVFVAPNSIDTIAGLRNTSASHYRR